MRSHRHRHYRRPPRRRIPELRIVDLEVWDAVKARQKAFALTAEEAEEADGKILTDRRTDRRRPKYLFAGLVKCGCCGGGYSMISKDLLGCSTSRNKGTCRNWRNIRRDALEASVLNGLRTHLMEPALFKEFCDEFTREMNRLRIEQRTDQDAWRRELAKIEKQIRGIIGDLAAMPSFAANTKEPGLREETGLSGDRGSQASLVAGAGFEPAAFRL